MKSAKYYPICNEISDITDGNISPDIPSGGYVIRKLIKEPTMS